MKQPSTVDKFTVAAALRETGLLLELKGAERFRAHAYVRAARSIAELSEDLGTLVGQGRLTDLKGVGRGLASQITELYTTGRSLLLDELRAELPPGVIELSRILSLKKIEALHEALGVSNLAELRAAAEAGKVRGVSGFGIKAEQKLLAAISTYENRDERILLLHALRSGEQILEHMRASTDLAQIELAGSVRRWKETVGTIRIVASARTPTRLLEHFLRLSLITTVEAQSGLLCAVRLVEDVKVFFIAVTPDEYPFALLNETGSRAHLAKLSNVARNQGLALTERTVSRSGARSKQPPIKSEADVYRQLGMQYIPPELREDQGEIEQALSGKLPNDLLTIADIQGMTHCHTTYSDGRHSIEEMALAAEAMGMKYLTITDHSPTAFYAGGVKVDRLKRQWDEIERVQERVKVKLMRGTESDILQNGGLDYPDHILERFDVIIASVHNRYRMDEAQMTRRLVAAMRNPFFKIWGHALGRLIQRRPPFACRVEAVLDAIAESRAAVEINGDPHRLDMEPRWLKEARKRRIKFVVSTDAHSTSDLQHLRFGIGIARRAGIRRAEVLNTLTVKHFQKSVLPLGI